MQKIILSLVMFLTVYVSQANDEFSQPSIDEGFLKLEKVENYIDRNQGVSLKELQANNSEMLDGILLDDSNVSSVQMMAKDMPLVGSFWWGCCLGVIGLALVYFITDNDKAQVKSALWGCLIATLLWGAGGIWNPFGWF